MSSSPEADSTPDERPGESPVASPQPAAAEAAVAPATAHTKSGPSAALGVFLLLLLLLALVNSGVAYLLWQNQSKNKPRLQALESAVQAQSSQVELLDSLRSRVEDNRSQAQRQAQEWLQQIESQSARLQQAEAAVELLSQSNHSLRQKVEGSATAWRLDAVEQLLLLANERLQLARDLDGAERALHWADERLQSLADPVWLDVRRQIASERAALEAVPRVDMAAISLQLEALADRVPSLPLAGHVQRSQRLAALSADTTPAAETDPSTAWHLRLWTKLRDATLSLVTIRQNTTPTAPLLPPDLHGLLVQNLRLQLEAARTALLLGDAAQYAGALDRASEWVRTYLGAEDAAVQATLKTLGSLRAAPVAPPMPDLSHSLRLLRQARSES
ncbi:MAG: uroporphyrinogen-III C-methyltransferase [Oceanococcaceae bacterium]